MLVDEILVKGNEGMLTGSYTAITKTLHQTKVGTWNQVPTFMSGWRARPDSNGRPSASEADTLSS